MEAVCTLGDATVAIVAFPSDDREAELLMYPSDGDVKMGAAIPRVKELRAGLYRAMANPPLWRTALARPR